MEERLYSAKANYQALVKVYPETKYRKEADKKLANIEAELQKYSN